MFNFLLGSLFLSKALGHFNFPKEFELSSPSYFVF